MNPSDETLEKISKSVDGAAEIARMFLPQYAAYIFLGSVVAKAAPALYADVVKLLEKADPTVEEKAELARKLQVLAHPEKVEI